MSNQEYIKNKNKLQALESKDVSKIKGLDNKFGNINFLLKSDVFEKLAVLFDCTSDNTYCYVPSIDYKFSKTDKNGNELYYEYTSPNEDNNFADLVFDYNSNSKRPISVKCSRVKTLHTINVDGRHLSFSEKSISNDNYILFYSIYPDEVDKVLIMNTKTYYDVFLKNNYDEHFKLFDINYTDKLKSALNLTDKDLKLIDLSQETKINKVSKTNIELKRKFTYYSFINSYKRDKKKTIYHKKTHYGKEYIAVNIKTNQTVHFRDSVSRNNFMIMNDIPLSDNHNIIKNCNCMDNIVNGNSVESCRTNIHENGWVIMNYHADLDIEHYIKTLFRNLKKISKIWKSRIEKLLCSIGKTIETLFNNFTEKLSTLMKKYKKQNNSYKPLHLWNFMITNEFFKIIDYFKAYPIMNRMYKFI
jgi:hypothetical protein